MSIKTLKIISIITPAFFIGVFEVLRHTVYVEREPMLVGNLVVVGVILVGAYSLSTFVFRIIDRTQRESLRRNQELTALNSVARAVSESLNLDVVLYRTLDEVLKVTNAEAGEIFLLDEQNQELVRRTHIGLLPKVFQETDRLKIGEGFAGTVVRTGEPIIVQDLSQEPELYQKMFIKGGFRSLVSVPLKSKNTNIGALNIISPSPGRFTTEDSRLLINIGHQIAVGIENARLHEKVQGVAALEERERLAREMHDGLAQVLSYVITKSQAAREFVLSGQDTKANSELIELETIAQEVYADVREVILGLRSTASPKRDIVSALREFVSRFSQMSGIRTELEIHDGKLPFLPTTSELQVIHIIQEALTNVRKHAGASHAWVRISKNSDQIEIVIEDDGHGFDLSSIRREGGPRFGLQTMRERTESLEGTLDIKPANGHGTKVILTIPINQRPRP